MKPSLAIETVINHDTSDDLLLCGIENLHKASYDYSAAIYYKNITENNLISKVIGLGEDNKFFYILESYTIDNKVVKYEHGLGYIYQNESGQTLFKRFLQIYNGNSIENKSICNKQISSFQCEKECTTVLRSTLPEHYFMCLYDDNCVMISIAPFSASSIKIENNSFLARIGESDLSNVSFDGDDFANIVVEALSKYSKQLSLKSSKLSVNNLSVKQLQLQNNNGTNVKKGTLVYDEELNAIKFYNGTVWRTLKWEDEEKSE